MIKAQLLSRTFSNWLPKATEAGHWEVSVSLGRRVQNRAFTYLMFIPIKHCMSTIMSRNMQQKGRAMLEG